MPGGPAEPRPRARPSPYSPHMWPKGNLTELEAGPDYLSVNLAAISRDRQTRRDFGPLSLRHLGHLLWLACRVHSSRSSDLGFNQQFRPLPSAGAVHPIHLVIQRSRGMGWEIYDPELHALLAILASADFADAARLEANKIVASSDAMLIGLMAEPRKTGAKYQNAESLVWRDAGVVIGYLSMFAEALGLSLCPLGATGDAHIAPLGAPGVFCGAGLLLVGARHVA